MADELPVFDNIRHAELLGPFIGQRVVEITQNEPDDAEVFVSLHFENGGTVTFHMTSDPMLQISRG